MPTTLLPGDSFILPFQLATACLFPLTGPLHPASLSQQELQEVDSLLLLVQQAHCLSRQRHYQQYLGVVNADGQKLV
jgi:hypothetical protein